MVEKEYLKEQGIKMKTIKIKYIWAVLMGMLLMTACETEIDFKGSIPDPLVVVNSFVSPDSLLTAHISKSVFFLSSNEPQAIDNAEISVFVNNTLEGKMTNVYGGYYWMNYKPKAGDIIRYSIEAPDLHQASSEALLLAKANILSIDSATISTLKGDTIYKKLDRPYGYEPDDKITPDSVAERTACKYRFTIKLKDPAGERNYYRLIVNYLPAYIDKYAFKYYVYTCYGYSDNNGYTETCAYESSYAPIYSLISDFNFDDVVAGSTTGAAEDELGLETSSNVFGVFNDDLFDGKEYPLTFTIWGYRYSFFPGQEPDEIEHDQIRIELQAISRDYYLYLRTREASENSMEIFSEPIQIHNNIKGGIGILGSYTSNVKTVEIK